MNKKIFIILGLTLFFIGGTLVLMKNQPKEHIVIKKTEDKNSTSYKTVQISDGQLTFSFEVPSDWFVETRNSGKEQMTEEEEREFLATAYQGKDAKANPDKQVSDYAYVTWNDLQKMRLSDMKQFITEREKGIGPYPNASVSGRPYIWYGDWNGFQIDFYITSMTDAHKTINDEKTAELKELKQYNETIAEMLKTQWTSISIDGNEAIVANYQLEVLENGERVSKGSKGRPGGKKYYIFFPSKEKALIIDKQSFISEANFEKNFDHFIQTLKFD